MKSTGEIIWIMLTAIAACILLIEISDTIGRRG